MPFGGFRPLDLIVILVIALLIFGPKKLPEMGSAIGKSITSFKKGMKDVKEEVEKDDTQAQLEERRLEMKRLELQELERELAARKAAQEAAKTPSTTESATPAE